MRPEPVEGPAFRRRPRRGAGGRARADRALPVPGDRDVRRGAVRGRVEAATAAAARPAHPGAGGDAGSSGGRGNARGGRDGPRSVRGAGVRGGARGPAADRGRVAAGGGAARVRTATAAGVEPDRERAQRRAVAVLHAEGWRRRWCGRVAVVLRHRRADAGVQREVSDPRRRSASARASASDAACRPAPWEPATDRRAGATCGSSTSPPCSRDRWRRCTWATWVRT